jgi:L-alanine-DL-glutamate epimerase-like enolase superfamily enzyme
LLARFDDQRAAVAAIDEALHDWLGKRRGLPLWSVLEGLGLDPARTPPTSMTIGLDPGAPPEAFERKVREADAFAILKVKVGTSDDVQTLSAIRWAAGDKPIRVDANGGWTADEAADRIAAIAGFNLELIEQPIPADPAGPRDDLRQLRESLRSGTTTIPIIADEDCVRPADLPPLAGVADGVNIKLAKCGGIVEAVRMIRQARSLELKVMIGCMVETSVGVAAAAHLASLADYADLDGHLLLADDPFVGLDLDGGVVRPSHSPGLGVSLRS